jgi:acetyl-CoA acetyltransferase family protein
MTRPVFVVDALRTPFGKHGGALAGVRPDDLAALVVRAAVDRTGIDPAALDDVVLGNGNGAGEENRNVARMAVLLAGLPVTVPGTTVNRLCGSGLEAIVQAARAIAVGDAELCLAGGVESMTRAPWVLMKPDRPWERDHRTLASTTLGWRLTNEAMPDAWTTSLGDGAEVLATRHEISRDAQDAWALRSHRCAARAWDDGAFDVEVVPVATAPGRPPVERDEGVRPDTSADRLAALPPAFRPDGTVTAGNASPLSDGAAITLLASEDAIVRHGLTPLARVAAQAVTAVEPPLYGIGPVGAAPVALDRAGRRWSDLTVVELNEAYASQVLACLGHWPELDHALVNTDGGAIALGHPIGASGARVLGHAARRLHAAGGGTALVALCIGVGQGLACVLEAC